MVFFACLLPAVLCAQHLLAVAATCVSSDGSSGAVQIL